MDSRPTLRLDNVWKLVWNVAILHLCTIAAKPKGSKSKFWLGGIPTLLLLIHPVHLGAPSKVKIKTSPLFLALFFHLYGGNGQFWSTIGHCWPQRSKNQNPLGESSSFMPPMKTNHMPPLAMAHGKPLIEIIP